MQTGSDRLPAKVTRLLEESAQAANLSGGAPVIGAPVEMEPIAIEGAALFRNNQSGSAKLSRKIFQLGQSVLHR